MSSLIGQSPMKAPKGYELTQIPRMSPESYNFWRQTLNAAQPGVLSGTNLLGKMAAGDDSAFQGLEAPYQRAFQKFSGDIGSRFSGMGMGARGSSGFQNALTEGATDLSERLGNQRLGLQQSALQQLLALSQSLLGNQPSEYGLVQKQPTGWQQLFGALGSGLGMGIGGLPGMFKWNF